MPRKGANLSPEAKAKNCKAITIWKVEHTENLSIALRKGKRDAYKKLAELRGCSVSSLVQSFLDRECEKSGIEVPHSIASCE